MDRGYAVDSPPAERAGNVRIVGLGGADLNDRNRQRGGRHDDVALTDTPIVVGEEDVTSTFAHTAL